jgi:PAS domain S-box-containing protein
MDRIMRTYKDLAANPVELRRRAENTLRTDVKESPAPLGEADARKLVHELQVHQIELEMQNAELQKARDEQAAALERYTDLYEFAPVGYLTLDRKGTVHSANLACASLLGIERSRLTGRWFQNLIGDDARPVFDAFLAKVFEEKGRETCELSVVRQGRDPIDVRLEAALCGAAQDCRVAVIDITERKRTEAQNTEAIGQLAGGVAHELRNQLAVITQACETLLRRSLALEKGAAPGPDSPRRKRSAKPAKRSGR